jgi:hypothetical protein
MHLGKIASDTWLFVFLVYLFVLGALMWCLDVMLLCAKPRLLLPYLRICWFGFHRSPYTVKSFERVLSARRHDLSLAELTYGYTPLATALWLMWQAQVNRSSYLVDVGSGRGRVLIAARFCGARSMGVELDNNHHHFAKRALQGLDVELRHEDAKTTDLRSATHVYLAWTTWSLQTRQQIKTKLMQMPVGAKVISVTWPLVIDGFVARRQSTYLFSWGFSPIWIYERVL